MTTSEPAPNGGETELLTLFAADSLASPSRSPGRASRRLTRGGSGRFSRASFAIYDRAGCLWRTFRDSLDGEWETFSETWPPSGMTRSGTAFRLPMSMPPIYANGSGLWPTPETGLSPNGHGRRGGKPGNGHQSGASLETVARMWPTPQAADAWLSTADISEEARERQLRRGDPNGSRRNSSGSLAKEVRWPTPLARDHRTGQPDRVGDPTRHGGWNLNDWAAKWPTPVASDAGTDRGSSAGWGLRDAVGGLLNPTWVEWLMGYPAGWNRLRGLGNAVVPQVAEHIGRLIMEAAA